MMGASLTEDLYAKLVNEEGARVCREIPESACREAPRNFFLLIGSYVLTKLGGMGALAQAFSVTLVILVLSLLGLAGAVVSWLLPETT
jgi:hypothetical protein